MFDIKQNGSEFGFFQLKMEVTEEKSKLLWEFSLLFLMEKITDNSF